MSVCVYLSAGKQYFHSRVFSFNSVPDKVLKPLSSLFSSPTPNQFLCSYNGQ